MSTALSEQINDIILESEYEVIQSMLSLENKQETMSLYSESFVQEADTPQKKPGLIRRLIEWIKKAIKNLTNKIKSLFTGKKKQPEVAIIAPKNAEAKQKELKNDIDKIDNETKKANSLVKKILIGLGAVAATGAAAGVTVHNVKKTKENIDNIKKTKSERKKLDKELKDAKEIKDVKENIDKESKDTKENIDNNEKQEMSKINMTLDELAKSVDNIYHEIEKIGTTVELGIANFIISNNSKEAHTADTIIDSLSKYITSLNELYTSLCEIDLDKFKDAKNTKLFEKTFERLNLTKKKVEEMIQQYGDIIKNINNVYANYDQLIELKEKIQKSPESYKGTDIKFTNLDARINFSFINYSNFQLFEDFSNKWWMVYEYKCCKLSSELLEDVIKKYNLNTTPSEIMSMAKKYKLHGELHGEQPSIFISIAQHEVSYSDMYVPIVTKDVMYDVLAKIIKNAIEHSETSLIYYEDNYHCKAVKFTPDKPVNIKGLIKYDKE